MKRTREQIKAAKARRDWELLQEKQQKALNKLPKMKKIKNKRKEVSLRDSA